ncbi:MAG: 3-deoxy-manno-octulosonate cytidylyltransferase [Syntrophobacteraceae bacterium CG2_30_61_12]|nr:MAG: 3-deoxy-manno-octulosonate cytidylyltransferase [Syntrophobacteraceae bacterium CG2_30_61_12]
MKIVAIVPARYASTRFPGKPLALLRGKPVIQWVWERVSRCTELDSVWIASDDERILNAVAAFGGRAIATRADHPSGTDRLAEAAANLGLAADDLVINVQGDEPMIQSELITTLIETLVAAPGADMGTLATASRSRETLFDPNVVKVVVDRDWNALYFSRAAIPHRRDPGEPHEFLQHLGFYAYRRAFLETFTRLPPGPLEQLERLEQLRALEHGYRIRVGLSAFATIGVDCPEDLARLEQTWSD